MTPFTTASLKRSLFSGSLLLLFCCELSYGQVSINEDSAVKIALQRYPQVKVSNLMVEQQQLLKPAGFNLSSPQLIFQSPTGDQMRPGIIQYSDFPTVYVQQTKLQGEAVKLSEAQREVNFNQLKYNVRNAFIEFQYWYERTNLLKRFDSIFSDLTSINEVRYRVGQISNLEKISGESRYKNLQFQFLQAQADLRRSRKQLLIYMGAPNDTTFMPEGKLIKYTPLFIITTDTTILDQNPLTKYYTQQIDYSKRYLKVERAKSYPGLIAGYLNQSTPTTATYYKFQYGVSIPIWYWQYQSRIRAAKKGIEISENQSQLITYQLDGEYYQALSRYNQYADGLTYYEEAGLVQAKEILKSASTGYRLGSIGYYIYLQNIEQAFNIEISYLEALKNYNQSILYIKYLKGEL